MGGVASECAVTDRFEPASAAFRKPALPRRFYVRAAALTEGGAFLVALDGKPVRTPARQLLAVPTTALAEALAAEWEAQEEHIDPAVMPLNRLVNSAIDGVAGQLETVRAEIVKYAASDLLCYRAEAPAELVQRQGAAWDPVLAWARDSLRARFVLAEGVMFVDQPGPALEAVRHQLGGLPALELAAVHTMTTLTGSAVLALAALHHRLSVAEAWAAAHVDEDWNRALWGIDAEAEQRRAARYREMEAAGLVLALMRSAATRL
jgi:chaperone required for assembly of F1-ATPase